MSTWFLGAQHYPEHRLIAHQTDHMTQARERSLDARATGICTRLSSTGLTQTFAGVDLWLADLDAISQAENPEWLAPSELHRASRFAVERDALRYCASHLALRQVLHAAHEVPGGIEFDVGPFGKPGLGARHACEFNLSHSGRFALIGTSQAIEIGVDIEEVRPFQDLWPLAEQHFTPAEYLELVHKPPAERTDAFFRCWTRKEACLKAAGWGLSQAAAHVEVGLEPTCSALRLTHEGCEIDLSVQSVPVRQRFLAAVARLEGRPRSSVRCR